MKLFAALTLFALLTGCTTIDPYAFTDQCIMEGHGRETSTHAACKNYHAQQYAEYRRRAFVESLNRAADRSSQEENSKSITCNPFGDGFICDKM